MKKTLEITQNYALRTYGYELRDDVGEIIMESDGFATVKEIKDYWHKIYLLLGVAKKNGEFD